MTSLEFFPEPENKPQNPIDWGTGKPPTMFVDQSVPTNPCWRYLGEPITQYYQVTSLRRSAVRTNDELVPKPQQEDVTRECIDQPFPSEHPYTSHVPRFAVFPKFDSPEDPKRGAAARSQLPISSEMPANPADLSIRHKIKGAPFRHEYVDWSAASSDRKPLYWPGEDFFDQPAKIKGERQRYFPTPPKLTCPNLQDRSKRRPGAPDLSVSARMANILRNIERAQWMSSYQMNYTGLGPSNPMQLDNLEEKQQRLRETGVEDDSLRPCSVNVFDPARPIDGNIPRNVCPLPLRYPSLVSGETVYDREYTGKVTLKEREEVRTLKGAEYFNVRDPSLNYHDRQPGGAAAAGLCLEKIKPAEAMEADPTDPNIPDAPFYPKPPPAPPQAPPQPPGPPNPGAMFLAEAKDQQDRDIQQMEAQNRWRVLESQTPYRDQQALKNRLHKLPATDKPPVFYRHEGRYNEERAGLYKTSYDPHTLTWSMVGDREAGSELTNTLDSNIQSQFNVSLPAARLNEDVNAALKWSRTYSLSKPELSGDRREGPEVMQTYNQLKEAQCRRLLPPPPHLACPRVQERELIENEATTMGASYNVHKFLQDYNIHPMARSLDPGYVMSHQNQNLDSVRSLAYPRNDTRKCVQFNPSVKMVTLPARDPVPTPANLITEQVLDTPTPQPHAPPIHLEDRNPPGPATFTPQPHTAQDHASYMECTSHPLCGPPPATGDGLCPQPPLSGDGLCPQPPPSGGGLCPQPPLSGDGLCPQPPPSGGGFCPQPPPSGGGLCPQPPLPNHPAPPGTAPSRQVRFAMDENNNAGGGDKPDEACRRIRFRSFPKRCPAATHGHGLIDSEYTDRFHGYVHSPWPAGPKPWRSSYQFPNLDLGTKHDARFQWEPGRGVPRPQTTLIKLQDDFHQTKVQRNFHQKLPEITPDQRLNFRRGPRHEFWGYNSQVIHG